MVDFKVCLVFIAVAVFITDAKWKCGLQVPDCVIDDDYGDIDWDLAIPCTPSAICGSGKSLTKSPWKNGNSCCCQDDAPTPPPRCMRKVCARGYTWFPDPICQCFLTCDYILPCKANERWDFIECSCVNACAATTCADNFIANAAASCQCQCNLTDNDCPSPSFLDIESCRCDLNLAPDCVYDDDYDMFEWDTIGTCPKQAACSPLKALRQESGKCCCN